MSKQINSQTGLADKIDAPAIKSGWGRNARINSNNSADGFIKRKCKQIGRFLIRSPTVEEVKDAKVVLWSEIGEDDLQTGLNISILLRLQSSKPTKRYRANIIFFQKREKFDVEAMKEVEDASSAGEKDQTALSQYALTAPVAHMLSGFRSWNEQGKFA